MATSPAVEEAEPGPEAPFCPVPELLLLLVECGFSGCHAIAGAGLLPFDITNTAPDSEGAFDIEYGAINDINDVYGFVQGRRSICQSGKSG